MKEIDLEKLNKNRVLIKDVFKAKKSKVEIAGWVHNKRGLGKIRFLILRDVSGIIQVIAVKGKVSQDIFKSIDNISKESVVYVRGSVKVSKQAPGGKEIIPEKIVVLAHAEELPIDVSDFSRQNCRRGWIIGFWICIGGTLRQFLKFSRLLVHHLRTIL